MPSPLLITLLLALVLVGLGYIFFFRAPSARTNASARDQLKALYATNDPGRTYLTVILYARVMAGDRMSAVLIGLPYHEKLDLRRLSLPRSFDDYVNLADAEVAFRQMVEAGDAGVVERASRAALNKTLSDLKQSGWQIDMQIPFSDVDHLAYLSREREMPV